MRATAPTIAGGSQTSYGESTSTGGGDADKFGPSVATGYGSTVTGAYNSAQQAGANMAAANPTQFAMSGESNAGTRAAVGAMTPTQQSAFAASDVAFNASGGDTFTRLMDQYGPTILAGAAVIASAGILAPEMAGVGAGVANAVGAGTIGGEALGSAAAGAATGAIAGTVGSVVGSGLSGTPMSLGSVAKGALLGAVGGGVAGGVSNAAANTLANSAASSLGASGVIPGALGQVARGVVGSAFAPSSNVTRGVAAGNTAVAGAGAIANGTSGGGNMAVNSGTIPTGVQLGNTLLSTAGGVLGAVGGAQQGNTAGNVLSDAIGAESIGTNTGYTGPNGSATINNGQVNSSLNPNLAQTNTNLGALGAQQSQIAGSFNGVSPAAIQNAVNSQAGQVAPTGTQGALGQQTGMQTAMQGSQAGLVNAGTNALNSPLTSQLQNAASTQLGSASSDFTNTYNTTLAGLNQQLALPAAQAQSQLTDAEFGRGQLGTSGGGLQTQAFATGLGQAYMGNQQTAYNEAMNSENSAVSNAGSLNAGANNNLATANSLLANAYGQFNNTSQINTNTNNSIANQNATISQLGNQYGQQNLTNQITNAMTPASLTSAYGANANTAISGATGLNNIGLTGVNASLAAGTQQGNQANNALGNASRIVQSNVPTNGLTSIGGALNSASGSNGLGGAVNTIANAFGPASSASTIGSTFAPNASSLTSTNYDNAAYDSMLNNDTVDSGGYDGGYS